MAKKICLAYVRGERQDDQEKRAFLERLPFSYSTILKVPCIVEIWQESSIELKQFLQEHFHYIEPLSELYAHMGLLRTSITKNSFTNPDYLELQSLKQRAETLFVHLESSSFPDKQRLADLALEFVSLQALIQTRKAAAHSYIQAHASQTEIDIPFTPRPFMTYQAKRDVIALCFAEKQYHLLPIFISHFSSTALPEVDPKKGIVDLSDNVYSFLLDKCVTNQVKLNGTDSKEQAMLLWDMVSQAKKQLSQDAHLSSEEKKECLSILDMTSQTLALLTYWYNHIGGKIGIAEQAFALLQDPQFQLPLLLPVGMQGHATLLSLEKTLQGIKATLYNSGYGLDTYHPKKGKYYQTYLSIENVPLEKLQVSDLLKMLQTVDSPSLDTLYTLFQEKGEISPPSASLLDYEQKQMHGTCATHCHMAFLRHFIHSQAQGNEWHKQGVYKALKTAILTYFGSSMRQEIISTLTNPFIQEKIEKLQQERHLMQLAQDQVKFNHAMEAISRILHQAHSRAFFNTFNALGKMTRHARYARLRAGLRDVAYTSSNLRENLSLLSDPKMLAYIQARSKTLQEAYNFLVTHPNPKQKKLVNWDYARERILGH